MLLNASGKNGKQTTLGPGVYELDNYRFCASILVIKLHRKCDGIVFNTTIASCILSSMEDIKSVPHEDKILESGDLKIPYIRGDFYNSTGLSKDEVST